MLLITLISLNIKPLTVQVENIDHHLVAMQCTARKPWVLAFLMDATWHTPPTQTLSQKKCTPPMATALTDGSAPLSNRTMGPSTAKTAMKPEWPKECVTELKMSTWPPNSPVHNLIKHPWDFPEKSSDRRRDCTCCSVGWVACVKWFLHGCREPFSQYNNAF